MLLLDEPLGALDLKLRKGLQIELKSIQRDVGITFVYVTHDQEEALTMSDRIAVMNHGVIEQLDAPEEVYERPRTEFVAGFIGVSNLMPGQVVSVERRRRSSCASTAGPTVRAPGDGAARRASAATRSCARRSCEVAQVEEPAPDGQPSVEGVVEAAVYLGTATQMVVRLAGDVPLTVLVPNADEAERQRLPGAGARVRLAGRPSTCTSCRRHGGRADADERATTRRRRTRWRPRRPDAESERREVSDSQRPGHRAR